MDIKQKVIEAIDGETEAEYDLRNKDKGTAKCIHNYDGQDHIRFQICRHCGCVNYNVCVNEKYDPYFDDYL